MAITIDLPPEVTSTADRAIIISLLWFRQGHGWQPPQIDGQRNMTTLLQPSNSLFIMSALVYSFACDYHNGYNFPVVLAIYFHVLCLAEE